jgi:hypothetical protein
MKYMTVKLFKNTFFFCFKNKNTPFSKHLTNNSLFKTHFFQKTKHSRLLRIFFTHSCRNILKKHVLIFVGTYYFKK